MRTVLVLSWVLAAVLGLVAGYIIGLQNGRAAVPELSEKLPAHKETASSSLGTPVAPAPDPNKVEPTPEETQSVETQPGEKPANEVPLKVIAAPEAALKAFLSAPDWHARLNLVLNPEAAARAMESHYATFPDGPVAALGVEVHEAHEVEDGETHFYTYLVKTADQPEGIPAAVVKTEGGWKVDWATFVEFQNQHFSRFAGGEGGDEGSFHLLVRVTHYFGKSFPEIEGFTAFRVDPPMPERSRYAFVKTDSKSHGMLNQATGWGKPCFPVLQLKRHPAPEGGNWLEITEVLAPNWWPVKG